MKGVVVVDEEIDFLKAPSQLSKAAKALQPALFIKMRLLPFRSKVIQGKRKSKLLLPA